MERFRKSFFGQNGRRVLTSFGGQKSRTLLLAVAFVLIFGAVGTALLRINSASQQLTWSPPPLVNPTTINLGTGYTSNTLDDNKDYIIKLPSSKKTGATVLVGGRNVVIIGGHVTVPANSGGAQARAFYIKDGSGTQDGRVVHIEGVLIDGSGGGDSDGFAIAAPKTIVQMQNNRVVGLTGSYAGYHNDVLQPWGGAKELRVDRLTGSTNYQAFQVPIDLAPIGKATFKNVNLSYTNVAPNDGGYMLWLAHNCNDYPVTLENFFIKPKDGRSLGKSVWPSESDGGCPARVSNNTASWNTIDVTGFVTGGTPANGDFVPAGVAGTQYTSPGYQNGGGSTDPTPPPPPPPDAPNQNPSLTISGLSEGQVVTGDITVEAIASDDTAVDRVVFTIDGTQYRIERSAPYCMNGDNGSCFTFDTTTLSEGNHSLETKAYDNLGASTTKVINFSVDNVPDPTVPEATLTLTGISSGQTVSGSVTVEAVAENAPDIQSVIFYLDGQVHHRFDGTEAIEASAPYCFNGDNGICYPYDTTALSNGAHNIRAVLNYSNDSKTLESSVGFTVENEVSEPDTTAPSVSINKPASESQVSGTVSIEATASDNTEVAKVEFYHGSRLINSDTSAPYTSAWNTTQVNDGTYELFARAYDAAGNSGTSGIVRISVKNSTEDTVSPSTPTNLGALAVSATQINLSWSASTDNTSVTGYDVYRDGNRIVSIPGSSTSYGDTGLSANTQYSYYVIARDAAGNQSNPSVAKSATTQSEPANETTTGNLRGVVYSDQNGKQLSGVVVGLVVNGKKQSVITNSDGSYYFSDLPAGNYEVTFDAHRHALQAATIAISPNVTTNHNTLLSRNFGKPKR